ncbi:hypothetical protein SeMB42_g02003 [Synchytrium endobioticum]|uniref:Uncharacterized protein n=1 Tax=Synchytrium endobioticum TaxID=286115 RepID=A0A507D0H4_9FUNG|nr:hypothetical protein SeLEV6574_g04295 [Synchytrium endobioticum]TPX51224.1 hypothetical protein SeMB42_g02003 [Synchytrium endobioticum]
MSSALPASILHEVHQLAKGAKPAKKTTIKRGPSTSSPIKSPRPTSPPPPLFSGLPNNSVPTNNALGTSIPDALNNAPRRVNFAPKPTILRSAEESLARLASPRSSASSLSNDLTHNVVSPSLPSNSIPDKSERLSLSSLPHSMDNNNMTQPTQQPSLPPPVATVEEPSDATSRYESRADAIKEPHSATSFSSRKEVASLKQTMLSLLREIGADANDAYPTELKVLLATIEEEQKIYDVVFKEVVRQVAVHMLERGELLAELRNRYAAMFRRIPQQVVLVHTELQASRRLNARLGEELKRTRQVTEAVLVELDNVKKIDTAQRPVGSRPATASSRPATAAAPQQPDLPISIPTVASSSNQIVKNQEDAHALLEKFHELYKLQRERLEVSLKECAAERTKWSQIATKVALRLADTLGMPKLRSLHLTSLHRHQQAGAIIMAISTHVSTDIQIVSRLIDDWRTSLTALSTQIVNEDRECVRILESAARDIDGLQANLVGGVQPTQMEASAIAVQEFTILDLRTLAPRVKAIVDKVGVVAARFIGTGGFKEIELQERVEKNRQLSEGWTEAAIKSLRRCEKTTNGMEYGPMVDVIGAVAGQIQRWLLRLEARLTGDDGGASQSIGLHNRMEDKYASIVMRDSSKPLSLSEQAHFAESFMTWKKLLETLTATLRQTAESDQKRIPLVAESWLTSLQDQLRTDSDCRIQENEKLAVKISQFLVKLVSDDDFDQQRVKQDGEELNFIISEIGFLNENLKRDSFGIEVMGDEGVNMHQILANTSAEWTATAQSLAALVKSRAAQQPHTKTHHQDH